MKLFNPINLITWVAVYVVTLVSLRTAPAVKGAIVGWRSPNGDYSAFYNLEYNAVGVETPDQQTAWSPEDWRARINIVRAYLDLLDQVTEAYIESRLGTFAEEVDKDEQP